MSLLNRSSGGVLDVIRCDEKDYLIWKWRPHNTGGRSKRENSIRWGSALRVKDGEVAVFFCSGPEGTVQEGIEGPFDGRLETGNLPVLSSIVELAYGGDSPYQAEIYFVNLAQIIQVKFGVPYFDVFDQRFPDLGVPVAVRGTISFHITDYQEFVKLNRLDTFSLDSFRNQIKDTVSRHVKSVVTNLPAVHNIPVVQMERKLDEINLLVAERLLPIFRDQFGATVTSIDIAAIETDKDSEEYRELASITQGVSSKKVMAQADADVKEIRDSQRLGVFRRAAQTVTEFTGSAVDQYKKIVTPGKEEVDPPPIPQARYYIAVDGKPMGPYDRNELLGLFRQGKFSRDQLIWKDGMPNWEAAGNVSDLSSIFGAPSGMPPIPMSE